MKFSVECSPEQREQLADLGDVLVIVEDMPLGHRKVMFRLSAALDGASADTSKVPPIMVAGLLRHIANAAAAAEVTLRESGYSEGAKPDPLLDGLKPPE